MRISKHGIPSGCHIQMSDIEHVNHFIALVIQIISVRNGKSSSKKNNCSSNQYLFYMPVNINI